MAEGEICVPEEILNGRPTVKELTQYASNGANPNRIGHSTLLGLADVQSQSLEDIVNQPGGSIDKMTKVYSLWIKTSENPTRREVLKALKSKAAENYRLAREYEIYLSNMRIDPSSRRL